jgi:Tfp pilus assembly protein PilF
MYRKWVNPMFRAVCLGLIAAAVALFFSACGSTSPATGGRQADAEAHYNQGVAYYKDKDYDRAIAEFTEAIRIDPNDAEAYFRRGAGYGSTGDYDQAVKDFTEAIMINPNDADAKNFLNRPRGRRGVNPKDLRTKTSCQPKGLG